MLQAALGGLLCFAACGDPEASGSGTGGSSSAGTPTATTTGSTSGGHTTASSASDGSTSESSGDASSSESSTGDGTSSSSSDASSSGSGTSGSASSGSASSSDASASSGTGTNPHTPIPNTACGDGQVENPEVTSSVVVLLSQEDFQAICAEAGGIFEIQPLCGGSNACRGIAYDSGTHVLTHHTCQATNTCAGYNCVVCDG